jgi:hypothetical protein
MSPLQNNNAKALANQALVDSIYKINEFTEIKNPSLFIQ